MNPLWDGLFAPLAARDTPLLALRDGSVLSGRDFHALVARQAGALAALGVGPGDRIAVQADKSPQALALWGAAVALGAVFLPLNTAYVAEEVAYFLADAEPRAVVADPARAAGLAPAAARAGARLVTLAADGTGSLSDLAAAQPATATPADRGPDDLAALLYTSGTTGRSKGAMLTQGNLLSNAVALAGLWRFTPDDVLVHALPIFHTHGLFVATNTVLLSGGRMILLPAFDAAEVVRLMPQATALMGVPTFYTRLLDQPGLAAAAQGMRLFVSGSAPLLAETHRAFADRTGHAILERYGMTETNMITSNPYDGERRAGTVGFPLPGVEVRLDAQPVGGIEVRGPNVFAGYWRMPEKTAQEFTADGWFRTGDIGTQDAGGYLRIVGRAKDLVISGGFNVYPVEVEEALDRVPGVLESAVIGLPHPDFGEAVFAVLVPRPGATLEAGAVLAAVRDRLARFKQPKAAVVVEALPRNAMGKVQKAALRKTYAGWFAAG
jgi:malonyl-CoA/methylmalonyl-CoA synthetase